VPKYLNFIKTKLFSDITSVPEALQGNYYSSLDGLRAIAIFMVLLPHFGINRILMHCGMRIESETGVHIFFVLSGFLITTRLIKERKNRDDLTKAFLYKAHIAYCATGIPVSVGDNCYR
jgi:hypothetical protein